MSPDRRDPRMWPMTGKTGAAQEKQLFDCVLVTKANVGTMTAPFTMTK